MSKLSNRNKGILCIISSAFFFALMGTFVSLAGDVPSMQKSFFRNLVALFVALVTLIKSGQKIEIHHGDLKYLILRSIFGTIGIFGNFYALDHLVLSDANMLNKLSPFFVIIFSFLILKEKFTLQQGIAVVIAFLGALFIIKPSGNFTNVAAIAGAVGGVGAGAAYTMVRILGKRKVQGSLIIFFFSTFSCLACIPFMIGNFKMMTGYQLFMLIGAGIAASGGQFSVTKAYFYAPANQISVYDYSQIIFAAALGFFVLGQIPDLYSVVGYVIICSMAVWMFLYNKKKEKISQLERG